MNHNIKQTENQAAGNDYLLLEHFSASMARTIIRQYRASRGSDTSMQ